MTLFIKDILLVSAPLASIKYGTLNQWPKTSVEQFFCFTIIHYFLELQYDIIKGPQEVVRLIYGEKTISTIVSFNVTVHDK